MNRTTIRSMVGPKAFKSVKNRDFLLTFSMFAHDCEILNWNFKNWFGDTDSRPPLTKSGIRSRERGLVRVDGSMGSWSKVVWDGPMTCSCRNRNRSRTVS